eukprot:TRINITY_DN11876_c1_g1_i2.p1 TRINITY_DN11876_c1_g1~~TRINITY_DN11876_c1_g1_i2.p1  ORF type:complete len:154 (-),score=23.87 TRINITY_DN11876_c1_g1_i2:569-1030(-)
MAARWGDAKVVRLILQHKNFTAGAANLEDCGGYAAWQIAEQCGNDNALEVIRELAPPPSPPADEETDDVPSNTDDARSPAPVQDDALAAKTDGKPEEPSVPGIEPKLPVHAAVPSMAPKAAGYGDEQKSEAPTIPKLTLPTQALKESNERRAV